ncbi:MAG: hypothetical protein J7L15_01365, partial [Clostridiales bacterium]|nr:hypothetical protein [Clostridiales bacterium]
MKDKTYRPSPDNTKWSMYRMEQAEYDCYPQRDYTDETGVNNNCFSLDHAQEVHRMEDIYCVEGEPAFIHSKNIYIKLTEEEEQAREKRRTKLASKPKPIPIKPKPEPMHLSL